MLPAQGRLAAERGQAFGARAIGRQAVEAGPDASAGRLLQPHRTIGPCAASSHHHSAVLRLSLRVRTGNSAVLPCALARHRPAPGQAEQSGLLREHSVEPRSIRPWVQGDQLSGSMRRAAGLSARPRAGAPAPALPRSPSKASTRDSTRLTLPSRIEIRSPKQKAAIAAAVERPMPGRVGQLLGAGREGAAPCARPRPGRNGAGCARGCSSPARSRAQAPPPAARRPTHGHRENARGSASSSPAPS